MAETVEIKVEGMAELARRMRELSPKLARNGLRAAVNAGAQVVRKDAQSRVARDTGTLRRAIYIKHIREQSSEMQQTFFVGVRQGRKERAKNRDAYYWRFVEFGTAKMSARPFMRPAFEAQKNRAADAIKAKLIERLDKLAAER